MFPGGLILSSGFFYMKKLLLIIVVLLFVGCESDVTYIRSKHHELLYWIDTITINKVDHEIIRSSYGLMHSPECQCLKNNEL